jgi:hypothetical protein
MFIPEKIDIEYATDIDKEVIRVKLPKIELESMAQQRERWACENKPGEWGRGLLKDAVGVGLRGEMAFAKILGLSIDLEPKAAGTGGGSDFSMQGVPIELKTKDITSTHNHLLVRCLTDYGNVVPMRSDIYVAARVTSIRIDPKHEIVHLMGWAEKSELEKLKSVKARRGSHKNKEIPYAELRDMRKLLDLIS